MIASGAKVPDGPSGTDSPVCMTSADMGEVRTKLATGMEGVEIARR
jgi:hypothetical protein